MDRSTLSRFLVIAAFAALIALTLPAASRATGGSDTIVSPSEEFVPLTGGGGGGGSGGAGNYWWFEIKGFDVLPWAKYEALMSKDVNDPPIDTTADERAIATKMASDCGGTSFWKATTGAKKGCVLWQNDCPNKANRYFMNSFGDEIQGCSAFASSYEQFAEEYNGNSEIHTIDYWGQSYGNTTLSLLIGWNVQVWRQGDSTPIFQRRIGLGPAGDTKTLTSDFDPPGISNHDWWFGGVGRNVLWSNNALTAGLLGAYPTSDSEPCRYRYDSAPTSFSYPGFTKPVANQARPAGTRWEDYVDSSGQQHQGRGGCYWSLGNGEGLWLKWTVASSGHSIGTISYTLQGRPGLFYAIHITSIDKREQLEPPVDVKNVGFWNADNYFRIFVATPGQNPPNCLPGDPPPCPQPPPPTPPVDPPPLLQSQLEPQTPMPTRAISTQSVQTESVDPLTSEQALFPETITLQHFTPQMNFNGSTISTSDYTDGSYAIYDSMTSSEPTVPYPYPGPKNGPQLLDMAYLQQPAHLSPDMPNAIASINNFQITWLHPTLNNPCPDDQHSLTAAWPASPAQCSSGANVRDAWDDALTGKTTYEAYWVGPNSTSSYGWVSNQWLRCNDPITDPTDGKATPVSNCNHTFKLQSYSGPEYTTTAAHTQYAQGYVNVAHKVDPWHPTGEGALHVILTGSAESALSGRSVYTRPSIDNENAYDVTPNEIDATHGDQPNSLTGDNELWYCKAGLPAGAQIAHGGVGNSGDSSVQSPSQTGDDGCQGYTVKWHWDSPGPGGTSNANIQDACSTVKPTPPPSQFHSPSINFMTGAEQSQAASWGLYSNYDGQHNPDGSSPMAAIFQGNPTNWDTLLSESDGPSGQTVPTVPYTGLRPGAGSGYDHPGCAKSYGDGRYDAGGWSFSYNDTKIVGYTPGQPAKYGWVCVDWMPAPGGRKRCIEYDYEETSPAQPAQPIYKTYKVYSWSWSGPCYPSNSTEQQQTATPTKKNGYQYYDSSVGGWVMPVHTVGDEQSVYNSHPAPSGDDIELANPISNMGAQTCGNSVSGTLQNGEWHFNGAPQSGFGRNQTGYRLPSDQYLVSYQFSGPNLGGLTWNLAASYDGFTGWKWYSKTMQNQPFTDPASQAELKVYGFRATR